MLSFNERNVFITITYNTSILNSFHLFTASRATAYSTFKFPAHETVRG